MSTKFYFSNLDADVADSINPTDFNWSIPSASLSTVENKKLLDFNSPTDYQTTVTGSYNVLSSADFLGKTINRVYFSKPLQAQNISGKVSGQLMAYSAISGKGLGITPFATIVALHVFTSGGKYTGTIGETTEDLAYAFPSFQNRKIPSLTFGKTAIPTSGKIVVEVGAEIVNTGVLGFCTYAQSFGSTGIGALALPIDETTTGDYNHIPWLQFSHTIL